MQVIIIKEINTIQQMQVFKEEFLQDLENKKVVRVGFDTETTGLHIMKDKPFLLIFGYQTVYNSIKVTAVECFWEVIMQMIELATSYNFYTYAWNTKFDMHMLANVGFKVTDLKWGDGIGVYRLTTNIDDPYVKKVKLKSVAKRYVNANADEFDKDVKKELTKLRKINKAQLKALLKPYNISVDVALKKYAMMDYLEPDVLEIVKDFKEANYSDVDRKLMLKYACNDVIVMLEYLHKATPFIKVREQQDILKEEFDLIIPLWEQERTGFKIDLDYLEASRIKLYAYMKKVQSRFTELAGKEITAGQHAEIKKLLLSWGYDVPSVSKDVLPTIKDQLDGRAKEFVEVLMKLRTIEKWYSTYILRFAKGHYQGKYHSSFNQFGTVSGRLSSDCQQFPKKAIYDDDGNEIFHPRRLVQPSGGGFNKLFLLD